MLKYYQAIGLACILAAVQVSCSTAKKTPVVGTTAPAKADTSDKAKPKTGMKPYKTVITKEAVSDQGVFVVHKVGEKYYYEIPDSLLEARFPVG